MTLEELKRLAEQAAKHGSEWVDDNDPYMEIEAGDYTAFIAACSPERILAMIRLIEQLAPRANDLKWDLPK